MSEEETKPKLRLFVRYIKQRVAANKSWLSLISGSVGSGKSYSALSFAEELSAAQGISFSISNVVFTVEDFLKLLTSGTLPRGSVIIFDELGVAANSRQFMSTANKALHYVAQTMRSYGNPIVLVTTPHGGFIDAGVRKLMHGHFETLGIDQKRKKVRVRPKMIQINQLDGTPYYKYLRVKHPESGKLVKLTRMGFGLPSSELCKQYEAKKRAYQDKLYADLLAEISTAKAKDTKNAEKEDRAVLSQRQDELLVLLKAGHTLRSAAIELQTTEGNLSQVKKALEKKGFAFKPIQKGAKTLSYDVVLPEGGYV